MKLSEVQCKHSDLEKQLADATLNITPEQQKINALFKTLHQRLLQGQKSFVDLTQQNSYMMLVETFHQQTAGAVATLMKEIPPQPLEDGSTFYWDFVLKNKHKIYFMQRK